MLSHIKLMNITSLKNKERWENATNDKLIEFSKSQCIIYGLKL